jgi:hypothetical protein
MQLDADRGPIFAFASRTIQAVPPSTVYLMIVLGACAWVIGRIKALSLLGRGESGGVSRICPNRAMDRSLPGR